MYNPLPDLPIYTLRKLFRWYLSGMILCLIFSGKVTGQDKTLLVSGIIRDDSSNLPVANASVKISATKTGTVSNSNGEFRVTYTGSITTGILKITCIGYYPEDVRLSLIQTGKPVNVRLKKNTSLLKEVRISNETAAAIVAHAYRNIYQNYPVIPTFYQGFYRESNYTLQNNSEMPLYMFESVINMTKPSYLKTDQEENIRLEETRKYFFPSDIKNMIKWSAGVYTPSRFDVVRKHLDFITPAHQKRYNYTITGHLFYNDQDIYTISFEPVKNARYRGKIYIGSNTYTIIKVDYELTETGLRTESFSFLNPSLRFNKRKFIVTYQPDSNQVWHLENIKQEAQVKYSGREYKYVTEYATMKFDSLKRKDFGYADKIQYEESLSTKKTPFHKQFWDGFNIGKSTKVLQELVIDTSRKILSKDTVASLKVNRKKKLPIKIIYTLPEFSLINFSAQEYNFRYASPGGEIIANERSNPNHTKIAISYGFGMEYEISPSFAANFSIADGFGKFKSSRVTFGGDYRFLLTAPNKRPVHLITGLSYTFNTIKEQLKTYQRTTAPIEIDGKLFSNDIRISLLNKQQGIRPYLGFDIEKKRNTEYFVQLSYLITTAKKDEVSFTDKSGNFFRDLFPKTKTIPMQSEGNFLSTDQQPLSKLPYQNTFFIGFGFKFLIK